MLRVGLTGGIGCGKSTATRRFAALGVPVIDADLIAREIVGVGQAALGEIVAQFGGQALQGDGSLDRAWLRQAVFGDSQRLQQLESILHPRIRKEILRRMVDYQLANTPYIIVDVPLLFEKGYEQIFDRVLVIDCLPDQQRDRVKQRDGSDVAVIDSIIQAQVPRSERLQRADDILENSGSLADFNDEINKLHEKYLVFSDT
jgi:dephospho-CoA kinase